MRHSKLPPKVRACVNSRHNFWTTNLKSSVAIWNHLNNISDNKLEITEEVSDLPNLLQIRTELLCTLMLNRVSENGFLW